MSAKKYQNKYRIKSARLEGYDYSRVGLYFVTICTDGMKHYFGEILDSGRDDVRICTDSDAENYDGKIMQLSEIGKIANDEWYNSLKIRRNIVLHEFVVMPNHIHGIIEIVDDVQTMRASSVHVEENKEIKNSQMKKISPKSGSLARIVGGYKSAVSKLAHRNGFEFQWQERYHDHIIRNKEEYYRISNYIKNNPSKWKEDKFNE